MVLHYLNSFTSYDSYLGALKITFLASVILYIKFQYSNLFGLGKSKIKAGKRAPEDFYQNKEPKQIHLDNLDRAQRIVNNDLENIPLALVLSYAALLVLYTFNPNNGYHYTAHSISILAFMILRILHTIMYALKSVVGRGLSFIFSLISVGYMLYNAARYIF